MLGFGASPLGDTIPKIQFFGIARRTVNPNPFCRLGLVVQELSVTDNLPSKVPSILSFIWGRRPPPAFFCCIWSLVIAGYLLRYPSCRQPETLLDFKQRCANRHTFLTLWQKIRPRWLSLWFDLPWSAILPRHHFISLGCGIIEQPLEMANINQVFNDN